MDILDSLVDQPKICIIKNKDFFYEKSYNHKFIPLSHMYKFMEESMDISEIRYRVLNWQISYGLFAIPTESIWTLFHKVHIQMEQSQIL
jgi:hypothetical protein